MRTRFLPGLMIATALAGCAGSTGPCPAAAGPPPLEGPADPCGAATLGNYVGVLATAEVRARIAATAGERPIRYIAPDDAVTMDFSESRLNVELSADGRITRLRCG